MLISISTQIFDHDGTRQFTVDPESYLQSREVRRRVAAQATLDGGSLIYDTGYSVSDRQFTLTANAPSEDLARWFSRLVREFDRINVSLPEGFHEAIPLAMRMDGARPGLEIRLIK
jgi:hypothetical protein